MTCIQRRSAGIRSGPAVSRWRTGGAIGIVHMVAITIGPRRPAQLQYRIPEVVDDRGNEWALIWPCMVVQDVPHFTAAGHFRGPYAPLEGCGSRVGPCPRCAWPALYANGCRTRGVDAECRSTPWERSTELSGLRHMQEYRRLDPGASGQHDCRSRPMASLRAAPD